MGNVTSLEGIMRQGREGGKEKENGQHDSESETADTQNTIFPGTCRSAVALNLNWVLQLDGIINHASPITSTPSTIRQRQGIAQ